MKLEINHQEHDLLVTALEFWAQRIGNEVDTALPALKTCGKFTKHRINELLLKIAEASDEESM